MTDYDERVDRLLDSWLEERRRAEVAELKLDALILAIGGLLDALRSTSFTPTERLLEALEGIDELIPDRG